MITSQVESRFPDQPADRRLVPLSSAESMVLLRAHTVGRIAWQAADGPQMLPVTYVVHADRVYFRTAPSSILSELVRRTPVVFEVDDLDLHRHTGWSVVVHGIAEAVATPDAIAQLRVVPGFVPWAPGGRNLMIEVVPSTVSGRRLSRVA